MNPNDDDPELARASAAQQLLLPNTTAAACRQIGLDWWVALNLWDDEWLSFDPTATPHLDEAQEAELLFVGSLVAGGCSPAMLIVVSIDQMIVLRIAEVRIEISILVW
jgi:hypothetical protein